MIEFNQFRRNLARFQEDLEPVLRASFDRLREMSGEPLAGYGLVSTETAETLGCVAQTRRHRMRSLAAAARLESARWDGEEWDLHLDDGTAHELLQRVGLSGIESDEVFDTAVAEVFEACVTVLERMVRSGYFDVTGARTDHVVRFWPSDWEDTDVEIAWVARLNPPELAEEFARYVRGEPSPLPVLDPFD